MTVFVTADTHFDHEKVIPYCNRPFKDVNEMNESLIDNWNSTIKNTDEVIHIGDFGFTGSRRTEYFLSRLNGHKTLICGNHDQRKIRNSKGWMIVKDYTKIRYNGYRFVACHFPILSWDKMGYGTIMLHGHCHGSLNQEFVKMIGFPIIDIGVDCWDYKPISLDEIIEFVNGQTYSKYNIDHHC